MATYVISDIHGEYRMFMRMLKKIQLNDTDKLYVLGDMIDRGPNPMKVILELMEMPNAVCLLGNHEYLALECLEIFQQEITDEVLESLDKETLRKFLNWNECGNSSTVKSFCRSNQKIQKNVIQFIKRLVLYKEVIVEGRKYLLVHGGLGNFSRDKRLEDYTAEELVWERMDYSRKYFEDKYIVTGHTPTQYIWEGKNPGYVYQAKNHIAIDCGACYPRGRLAVVCLETREEFYVERRF